VKPRPSHFVLAVLSAFLVSGFASAAERMYDAELERLIASTNRSVVAFRKAARADFRNSRITWNGTQTAVGNYLEDLEDAGKKLESRYDLNYAAVSEATDFLKRLKGADEFAVANPGISGAKNEWDVVRTNATALARAYGVDFAADASTWQPARTPDGPIRAEAFSIESQAKTLGKSLDSAAKSAGLDKSRRKVIEGQSETASKAAVDLRRAVDAGRDSAPATQRLTAALADLQATIEKDGLADRVASSWSALQDSIAKLTGFLGP
jgi:hypothetical protein